MAGWMSHLREIGDELDRGACPRVGDRGMVMPSESSDSSTVIHEDQENGRSARRAEIWAGQGSAGGQRAPGGQRPPGPQGPTRGQGPARGQRPSDAPTSDIGSGVPALYETNLEAVQAAYPGVRIWRQDGGFWLLTESMLLPGLRESAVFLTGFSPQKEAVKSWGFWRHGCVAHRWIGPRHTNFPDGSVCAFEPRDGTWVMGEPIVDLLDLYSLWALRHLYLTVFGRWPGPQSVPYAYERIAEMREDELCGCGGTGKRYGECCAPIDRAQDQVRVAVNFLARVAWERKPPPAVVSVLRDHTSPPQIDDFFDKIGYMPMTYRPWTYNTNLI